MEDEEKEFQVTPGNLIEWLERWFFMSLLLFFSFPELCMHRKRTEVKEEKRRGRKTSMGNNDYDGDDGSHERDKREKES